MCRVLRRDLITFLGGAAAAWPVKVGAQAERVWRMDVLLFSAQDRMVIKPLLDKLQARGYVDGKIEYRVASSSMKSCSRQHRDHWRPQRPDVLVSHHSEESAIEMSSEEQEQVRQFILDEDWTLPVMAWEHPSLRHKLAAVGAALVGERSMEKRRRLLVGGEWDRSARRCQMRVRAARPNSSQ
jgi:hypothetical protein